jgi:hypothetical protein
LVCIRSYVMLSVTFHKSLLGWLVSLLSRGYGNFDFRLKPVDPLFSKLGTYVPI